MSYGEVLLGLQIWSDYTSNQDRFRFEKSIARQNAAIQTASVSQIVRSLDFSPELRANREANEAHSAAISAGFSDLASGINQLHGELAVLMGDVIWQLQVQSQHLSSILQTLQSPLDTQAKELRARAVDAYNNGWFDEALNDFLESERKNYQDFLVLRYVGNIYLYKLADPPKALEYFRKTAKYATPRDSIQASEGHYFAGIACGLCKEFKAGLDHFRESFRLNPDFSEAYFEGASFAAMLEDGAMAKELLEKAIWRDPTCFERAMTSALFDRIRREIDPLLDRLATAAKNAAEKSIHEMDRMIETLKKSGSDQVVRFGHALYALHKAREAPSYLVDRSISTAVDEYKKTGFEHATKSIAGEIAASQNEAKQIEKTITQTAADIQRPLNVLLAKKGSFKRAFKSAKWNAGCGSYFLLWFAYIFILVYYKATHKYPGETVGDNALSLLTTLVVPFVIPAAYNGLSYLFKVVLPGSELNREINDLKPQIAARQADAESQAKQAKNELTQRIHQLEMNLELCQRRCYL